jgi:tRNA(adenine34) deaminase
MAEHSFMAQALAEAETAAGRGEVPVGAVLVDGATGEVLARAHNLVEDGHDPTAHAEMLVIRQVAKARGTKRLETCDLYVTM